MTTAALSLMAGRGQTMTELRRQIKARPHKNAASPDISLDGLPDTRYLRIVRSEETMALHPMMITERKYEITDSTGYGVAGGPLFILAEGCALQYSQDTGIVCEIRERDTGRVFVTVRDGTDWCLRG
jgi:hypothetical protein